ncbi:MAG: DUF6557 family protein [Acidaminobacteraceae bacterium]
MTNFKEHFEMLSDLDLRDVVTIKADEYTPDAILIANEVLISRGLSDLKEKPLDKNKEIEIVHDCLATTDFEIIREKLGKLFLENEENLDQYKSLYTDLLKMTPVEGEEVIYAFIGQTSENFAHRYPFDVFGIEDSSEEYFGLELYPWNEWLSFKINDKTKDFIAKAGVNEFMAICLHKMAAFGFSEEEIQNSFNNSFEEFEESEGENL